MFDLYLEANLPTLRAGMRRGYFFLMTLNVGLFGLSLTHLYAAVFTRAKLARWGWLFLAATLAAIAADATCFSGANLPPVSLQFLKVAASVIGCAILLIFATPRFHVHKLADFKLRRYANLAFILFGLLLALYLVKQATGDKNEFFAVFGRIHFGVFFAVTNLTTLYLALNYLGAPTRTPTVAVTGEIRLSAEFSTVFNLTPRENIIVREIIAGKSNREIARALGVTEGTVKIFVYNIYKKTGINNRMALAALVRQHQRAD